MFNAPNLQSAITWRSRGFVTSLVIFVYIQSVISMHCFTLDTIMASGGDGNFPEQSSDARSLRLLSFSF